MEFPPPDVLHLMTLASELRARGCSWETIGLKLHRTGRSCRRWTDRYPEVWEQLYQAEKTRLVVLVGNEAMECLRQMLRDKDGKLRQNAAKFLCTHTDDLLGRPRRTAKPAAPPGEWAPFIAYLESHSDEEVRAYVEQHLANRHSQAGAAVPAGGCEPGPAVGG